MSVICVFTVFAEIMLIQQILRNAALRVQAERLHRHFSDRFQHNRVIYRIRCILSP